MSDIRLRDADAETIAGLHQDAAEGVEGAIGQAPASVDAGPASALLAQVLATAVLEADNVAVTNLQVANLVTSVKDDFYGTEAEVREAMQGLREELPR